MQTLDGFHVCDKCGVVMPCQAHAARELPASPAVPEGRPTLEDWQPIKEGTE